MIQNLGPAGACDTRAALEKLDQRPAFTPSTAQSQICVLGIDLGASGAIALISRTGELIGVDDMPILRDGGAKDAARSEAIRRWPAHAALFARVRDDGRAEACLIAVAGLMREVRR